MLFSEVLYSVKCSYNVTIKNMLMIGPSDMDKNLQKSTKNKGFSPIVTKSQIFSKIGLLSLLYPCGVLSSCKKLEKTSGRSLRSLKTDGLMDRRMDRGENIRPLQITLGPKLNQVSKPLRQKS